MMARMPEMPEIPEIPEMPEMPEMPEGASHSCHSGAAKLDPFHTQPSAFANTLSATVLAG
jgi:hypothetical protein